MNRKLALKIALGAGEVALYRFGLPHGDVYSASACAFYAIQPIRHTGCLSAFSYSKPPASPSVIAFTAWSSFSHAALIYNQACRNMVAREELIGVGVLVLIGALLIALAPSKQRLGSA
jgi:hypothetical protein